MIYGINFGAPQIPSEYWDKGTFPKRLNAQFKAVGWDKSCTWLLTGVCTTGEERNRMCLQAHNGSRKIHVVERGDLFGIYTG